MSHLIIEDLNFCQRELPEQEHIQGSGINSASFFGFAFDFAKDFAFKPSGEAAAGSAIAIALAIGGHSFNIGVGTGTASG
ncbi:hypothetical protein NIES593_18870 [Hydrococcus rivularis NIES-593]|uniref:Uncharacterized protein n=1 Tax=Hydrococcus rivularis NIES-593 TaxID=1921803 RepID=A0A1U7HA73_9CYAN|nr:hypothetical protein [Hydrococcus rivularis]OKH20441.1 hypothetical protein NIES593_18870 [Hydrococcus rivularis NIES-593]